MDGRHIPKFVDLPSWWYGMWIRVLPDKAKKARPSATVKDIFAQDANELRMFNVPHGEAVLLRFPQNRAWLVDCGNSNNKKRNDDLAAEMLTYLENEGLTLEAIVASHAHVDHEGSIGPLTGFGSNAIATPLTIYRCHDSWSGTSKWLGRYHARIAVAGAAVTEVVLRDSHREIAVTTDISAHLFAGSSDGPYASIFLQLRYRNARILFTGDTHCSYEKELLDQIGPNHFRADIYEPTSTRSPITAAQAAPTAPWWPPQRWRSRLLQPATMGDVASKPTRWNDSTDRPPPRGGS